MSRPIRILVADDNAVFRQGLRRLLSSDPEIEVVGEAEDGLAVVEQALLCHPDVVLMDIRMPGQSGLEAAQQIRAQCPQIQIVILTAYDSPALRIKALDAGVTSYLSKEVDSSQILRVMHSSSQAS